MRLQTLIIGLGLLQGCSISEGRDLKSVYYDAPSRLTVSTHDYFSTETCPYQVIEDLNKLMEQDCFHLEDERIESTCKDYNLSDDQHKIHHMVKELIDGAPTYNETVIHCSEGSRYLQDIGIGSHMDPLSGDIMEIHYETTESERVGIEGSWITFPREVTLIHELEHAHQNVVQQKLQGYLEVSAVEMENVARKILGLRERVCYGPWEKNEYGQLDCVTPKEYGPL